LFNNQISRLRILHKFLILQLRFTSLQFGCAENMHDEIIKLQIAFFVLIGVGNRLNVNFLTAAYSKFAPSFCMSSCKNAGAHLDLCDFCRIFSHALFQISLKWPFWRSASKIFVKLLIPNPPAASVLLSPGVCGCLYLFPVLLCQKSNCSKDTGQKSPIS